MGFTANLGVSGRTGLFLQILEPFAGAAVTKNIFVNCLGDV
jgi:hypothetical protein